MSPHKKTMLIYALIALQILLIPLAILAPFFTSTQDVSMRDGMLSSYMYYDFTIFIVALPLLLAMLLWLPAIKKRKDRGSLLLMQLLASLFILGPTLMAYAFMRDAAQQRIAHDFFTTVRPGGAPLLMQNWFTNFGFGPGLSPLVVLALYVLFVAIPAFGAYRHFSSKKHVFGINKKELFK